MNMRYTLERVLNPESEPVTRQELKTHIRGYASDTSEDDMLDGLIVAAREWLEGYTGRALMDQSWRLTVEHVPFVSGDRVAGYTTDNVSGSFVWTPNGEILLRKSPALAITSFVTVDAAGDETTVDAATYELREAASKWPRIVPLSGASWGTSTMRIVFRAGFADTTGSPQQTAAEVPERFKIAMKLYAEAHYDRDPVMMEKLIAAAESIARPDRCESGFA